MFAPVYSPVLRLLSSESSVSLVAYSELKVKPYVTLPGAFNIASPIDYTPSILMTYHSYALWVDA